MDRDQGSLTAMGASLMRAIHTRLDDPPLLDDPWGEQLVTESDREALWEVALGGLPPEARDQIAKLGSDEHAAMTLARAHPSYGSVIVRARYNEDTLAAAVGRGIRRYVVVGAGLDSFALRRPAFAQEVEVFEVDHPATQALKLERLREAGVEAPTGVRYIAADLAEEPVDAVLRRSGFEGPAFFSWLGVTHYLTREANLGTLGAIARGGGPGSELVFTYLDQHWLESSDPDVARARETLASLGEPWVSGFEPPKLRDELRGVGLELVEDLSSEDLHERYCADRDDGLSPLPAAGIHVAHARVGG